MVKETKEVKELLIKLFPRNSIIKAEKWNLKPNGPNSARLYGLPKILKPFVLLVNGPLKKPIHHLSDRLPYIQHRQVSCIFHPATHEERVHVEGYFPFPVDS